MTNNGGRILRQIYQEGEIIS